MLYVRSRVLHSYIVSSRDQVIPRPLCPQACAALVSHVCADKQGVATHHPLAFEVKCLRETPLFIEWDRLKMWNPVDVAVNVLNFYHEKLSVAGTSAHKLFRQYCHSIVLCECQ